MGNLLELVNKVAKQNEKLKDEVSVFKSGFDGITDGFWVYYLQQDYEYLSPKFKEMLGYSDKEGDDNYIMNHPSSWQKLLHPDDLGMVMANLEAHILSRGAKPFNQKVRYIHKDGHLLELICKGNIVRWDGDTPSVMIGGHFLI